MEGYFIVKNGEVLAKYPPTFDPILLKKWVEKEGGTYPTNRTNGVDCGNGVFLHTYTPKQLTKTFDSPLHKGVLSLVLKDNYVEKSFTCVPDNIENAKKRAHKFLEAQLKGLKPIINVKGVELTPEEFVELQKEAAIEFAEDPQQEYIYEKGDILISLTRQELNKIDKSGMKSFKQKKKHLKDNKSTIDNAGTFEDVLTVFTGLSTELSL